MCMAPGSFLRTRGGKKVRKGWAFKRSLLISNSIALCSESVACVISVLWMIGVCLVSFHECVLHI